MGKSKHKKKEFQDFKEKHCSNKDKKRKRHRHKSNKEKNKIKCFKQSSESNCRNFDADFANRDACSQSVKSSGDNISFSQFDWESHKRTLNLMFFRDQDTIKRGTSLYNDFWIFLKKYQAVHLKSSLSSTVLHTVDNSTDKVFNFPMKYDQQCKINFSVQMGEVQELMNRGYLFDLEDEDVKNMNITKELVSEFRLVVHLYLDFLQKQKFIKLNNLRRSQEGLPINSYRSEIVNAVQENQVVVVAGDTGCGKSTQVPQYLLAAGIDSIACTQPRRIACISLCKRVAYETLNEYKSEVGYQIRFEKSKTEHTKILFLTEGLLLRQVSDDPLLSNYKVIIIDEVHERHLPCDFLLGIIKCLIHQRSDLKVVLMSATINIQLFSNFFDNCPIIQVPGRLFPIQVQYCEISPEEQTDRSKRLNPSPYLRILQLIDHKYPSSERGDVLIFLSGMSEISAVEEAVRLYSEQTKKWIVLPLHSTLSVAEQDKVFHLTPEGVRKCIISTNIAETSITIDGIRFVVDSGKVKEMSYDSTCRLQKLKEFWISCASAEQRKGRAGRTGPGVCFRMYSKLEYEAFNPYSTPEIQRVPLDSLILQMISLGLPDARKFPFIESPPLDSIEETLHNLKEQGALNDDETLTPMGKMLSKLPVDVTIGKMLVLGSVFHIIDASLSLAAVMSVQSPFTNNSFRNPDAVAARKSLQSDNGDPFTILNAYNKWLEMKSEYSNNSRKWCRHRGIEEQRFYEVTKLRRQFKELLHDSGLIKYQEQASHSTRRVTRHGELKHLREMKKQFHRTSHKKKFLKLDQDIDGIANSASSDDGDKELDIQDIDFKISWNRHQVKELSAASQPCSYKDLSLLKLIVCSGIYPQIAIADDHNSYKSDSEQLFHTKGKPFVALHPNGVFSLEPDLLKLREMDIQFKKGFTSHTPLSCKHQLIAYVSLLETTKPYLVNCIRVPAAHILLLLSHQMDTNQDLTHIVCDGWMELRFLNPEQSKQLIAHAIHIRDKWQDLLQKKFQESFTTKESKNMEINPETWKMQRELSYKIEKFFHLESVFTVRRLLAADIKAMYIGSEKDADNKTGLSEIFGENTDFKVHPIKGGLCVNDYLVYNCLLDADHSHLEYLQKHWQCPDCGLEIVATVLDQIRHQEKCQQNVSSDNSAEKQTETAGNCLKNSYFCPKCQEVLYLTSIEILRHKHHHKKMEK